jgi:hypothetical protein
MVPQDPNPFGESRKRRVEDRKRRVLASLGEAQADIANTATAAGPSRAERIGRRAGEWAAQSRVRFAANVYVAVFDFTATLTRRPRDFVAKLKQSKTVMLIGTAILLVIWVGAIVYSVVTGEGSGPG